MEKVEEFSAGMKATTLKNHFDSSLRDRYFRRDQDQPPDSEPITSEDRPDS